MRGRSAGWEPTSPPWGGVFVKFDTLQNSLAI